MATSGSDPPRRPPEQQAVLDECLRQLDAVWRTARRMTGNEQDAEDLVQETYLKATRSVHRYREGAGVRAWLFRILTNAYIDRYRRSRREPDQVPLAETGGLYDLFLEARGEAREEAPRDLAALGEFLHGHVGDEVRAAVESLPPDFRLVLVLRDVEGLSYREISETLGIPIGTVMSRLFRARRALQSRLAAHARAHGWTGPGTTRRGPT
jgi:RNA polymerase sigma-70 factor (ECF subfamily)